MSNHNGRPITDQQTAIYKLWQRFNTPTCPQVLSEGVPVTSTVTELTDQEVYDRASAAANAKKFLDLWNGDFATYYPRADGTGDQSKADLALINILAFHSGNSEQTKRLFMQSALGQREKAKRDNYVDPMIHKALSDTIFPAMIPGQFDSLMKPIEQDKNQPVDAKWPVMADAAFHGVAGKFVRAIEPHSEADIVALLVQFLVAIGCLFGRGTYKMVESTKHHSNLFSVIVGLTANARKGTSWGWIRQLVKLIEAIWFSNNCVSGSSSGEGLIDHIHDSIEEEVPISGDIPNVESRRRTIELGKNDKRLLVVEDEFGNVLNVAKREGNTLIGTLRKAWDGNDVLQTLTRRVNKLKATDAHIAVIGHITELELKRGLSTTDCYNGFGNRILWVRVKRSKRLPIGTGVNSLKLLQTFVDPICQAIEHASQRGPISFDEDAKQLWRVMYDSFADRNDLVGAMTARAEAQVIRLAMIYAILDCANSIEVAHLKAGKAVWDYCEQSAQHLFGDSTGNTLADSIYGFIVESGGEGLSRTEINNKLNRNKSKSQIDYAINLLTTAKRIRTSEIPTRNNRTETRYLAIVN